MRTRRLGALVVGIGLVAASGALAQDSATSGTVTLESTSVALGVGVVWGDGVLTYQGKTYAFKVSGLSVADIGVAKASAKGEVRDLKTIEDFAGTYAAATAGAAAGPGASVVAMQNPRGVTIVLKATSTGFRLALATQGVEVRLAQ